MKGGQTASWEGGIERRGRRREGRCPSSLHTYTPGYYPSDWQKLMASCEVYDARALEGSVYVCGCVTGSVRVCRCINGSICLIERRQ